MPKKTDPAACKFCARLTKQAGEELVAKLGIHPNGGRFGSDLAPAHHGDHHRARADRGDGGAAA